MFGQRSKRPKSGTGRSTVSSSRRAYEVDFNPMAPSTAPTGVLNPSATSSTVADRNNGNLQVMQFLGIEGYRGVDASPLEQRGHHCPSPSANLPQDFSHPFYDTNDGMAALYGSNSNHHHDSTASAFMPPRSSTLLRAGGGNVGGGTNSTTSGAPQCHHRIHQEVRTTTRTYVSESYHPSPSLTASSTRGARGAATSVARIDAGFQTPSPPFQGGFRSGAGIVSPDSTMGGQTRSRMQQANNRPRFETPLHGGTSTTTGSSGAAVLPIGVNSTMMMQSRRSQHLSTTLKRKQMKNDMDYIFGGSMGLSSSGQPFSSDAFEESTSTTVSPGQGTMAGGGGFVHHRVSRSRGNSTTEQDCFMGYDHLQQQEHNQEYGSLYLMIDEAIKEASGDASAGASPSRTMISMMGTNTNNRSTTTTMMGNTGHLSRQGHAGEFHMGNSNRGQGTTMRETCYDTSHQIDGAVNSMEPRIISRVSPEFRELNSGDGELSSGNGNVHSRNFQLQTGKQEQEVKHDDGTNGKKDQYINQTKLQETERITTTTHSGGVVSTRVELVTDTNVAGHTDDCTNDDIAKTLQAARVAHQQELANSNVVNSAAALVSLTLALERQKGSRGRADFVSLDRGEGRGGPPEDSDEDYGDRNALESPPTYQGRAPTPTESVPYTVRAREVSNHTSSLTAHQEHGGEGTPNHSSASSEQILKKPSSNKKEQGSESKQDKQVNFPGLLMDALMNYADDEAFEWLPDGRSFVIVNPDVFACRVLQRGFPSRRPPKYLSFVRRLYRWGFTKITSGSGTDCFWHDSFQKGKKNLATRIPGESKIHKARLAMIQQRKDKEQENMEIGKQTSISLTSKPSTTTSDSAG